MLVFVTERTESVLSRAKYSAEQTIIPNSHPCFDHTQIELWRKLADGLGIDFDQTQYTLRVVVKNQIRIDTPYVGNWDDQACIVWGNVKQPLTSLDKDKVQLTIGGGKRPCLEAYIDDLEDTLNLFMMLPKEDENSPPEHLEYFRADEESKKNILRKALRVNRLHKYLSQSYEKPKKLAQIAGKSVEVYGYQPDRWGKYVLSTSEGLVLANSAISRRLDKNPVITKSQPAILEVSAVPSGKTSNGYDIYYAVLTTQADKDLPEFEFTS